MQQLRLIHQSSQPGHALKPRKFAEHLSGKLLTFLAEMANALDTLLLPFRVSQKEQMLCEQREREKKKERNLLIPSLFSVEKTE